MKIQVVNSGQIALKTCHLSVIYWLLNKISLLINAKEDGRSLEEYFYLVTMNICQYIVTKIRSEFNETMPHDLCSALPRGKIQIKISDFFFIFSICFGGFLVTLSFVRISQTFHLCVRGFCIFCVVRSYQSIFSHDMFVRFGKILIENYFYLKILTFELEKM